MKIHLARHCIQRMDVKKSDLINYIKLSHMGCGKNCDVYVAIRDAYDDRELIDVFLDIDGDEGFINEQHSKWSEIPNSHDEVKLVVIRTPDEI